MLTNGGIYGLVPRYFLDYFGKIRVFSTKNFQTLVQVIFDIFIPTCSISLFLDSITVEENTSKYNFYILVSFILWNRDDCYPRKYFYLSKCNWTRTQNHLVGKWTLNHLTKLAEHYIEFYIEHYIWRNWPNGWGFIYELSGFGFESSCSHFHGLLLFISVFLGERGTRQKFNIKSLLK